MKTVVSGKLRSFHQGDRHKLQLTANLKSVWKGALVDEFSSVDQKSTRYFRAGRRTGLSASGRESAIFLMTIVGGWHQYGQAPIIR